MTSSALKGLDQFKARIAELTERIEHASKATAYTVGNVTMTEAKENAPKLDGHLRASGYVTLPTKEGAVELGFGGVAADYAERQHENSTYQHTEGGWKYLERALLNVNLRMVGQLFQNFMTMKRPKAPAAAVPTDPWEGADRQVRRVVSVSGKAGSVKTERRLGKSARASAMAFLKNMVD